MKDILLFIPILFFLLIIIKIIFNYPKFEKERIVELFGKSFLIDKRWRAGVELIVLTTILALFALFTKLPLRKVDILGLILMIVYPILTSIQVKR